MRTILLALAALLLPLAPVVAAPLLNGAAETMLARGAEERSDWDAALLHYENVYDSSPTTPEQRLELRQKFRGLRAKVAPNTDPARAGVYRIKCYIFRTLEVKRLIERKETLIRNTYTDAQIAELAAVHESFTRQVWEHTLGNLLVTWDTTVIETPLRHVDGWPDPTSCAPFFTDLKAGEQDCVMVYAQMQDVEPWALWGGTIGCIPEVKGAMYIGLNDNDAGISRNPTAEVQIHEWLHAVQGTIEEVQGYPAGLAADPDCGGNCSGKEGLTCFDGAPDVGAPGWMPLYYHMIDTHLTRRMWRQLSVTRQHPNPWTGLPCREFLLLGPFDPAGAEDYGLGRAFLDEESERPAAGGAAGDRTWRRVRAAGRSLNIAQFLSPAEHRVAYVAVYVHAPQAGPAQVRIGTDDGCKLWHDGVLVHTDPALQSVQFDHAAIDVSLREGANLFLLKVANAEGGWGAIFRVCDRIGAPIAGVTYSAGSQR